MVVLGEQETQEVWRYNHDIKQFEYYRYITTVFLKTLTQMDN
jgi:hypothetical protein